MRLFNLDAHISVIADVENIFTHLYPEIEITNWSLSNHKWVFGEEVDQVEVVNQNTWLNLNLEVIAKFQDKYDDFLSTFDGFICCFPPVFCLLFEKYKKPIFIVNATRYEMPFCWKENSQMQAFYEEKMLKMQISGQLIVVSNNKADAEYLERATGVKSQHIPSICRYTQATYEPKKEQSIFFCKMRMAEPMGKMNMIHYKDLGRYQWQDLYSYKAIVHLPYEISTMSIFEHYSANVPLLFPTKRFLKDLLVNKRIKFNGPYSSSNYKDDLEDVLGLDWFDFWLDRADYYDSENMPFITYYDNMNEIPKLLSSIDTQAIHLQMKEFNKKRFSSALTKWRELLEPHYCD